MRKQGAIAVAIILFVALTFGQDEQARRDAGGAPSLQGVTNDAAGELRNALVDPITTRILVDSLISSGGSSGVTSEPTIDTYTAAALWLAPVGANADMFILCGSASTTIKVRELVVSWNPGGPSALTLGWILDRRSTDNTGGTSTVPASIEHDTTGPSATAILRAYTVVPTKGTSLGALRIFATGVDSVNLEEGTIAQNMAFGSVLYMPLVLRGVAECVAVNTLSAVAATTSINLFVTWTEE